MRDLTLQDIKPDRRKAIFYARRQLAEFVYDAVNLEDIPMTLPEVQTLLDNITVGGHKISDQNIVLNQAAAWRHLFASLEAETFTLSKAFACTLHSIAAEKEALTWGKFRDGPVRISGTSYIPSSHQILDQLWEDMLAEVDLLKDPYQRAMRVFLRMARQQFFFDVNKRMGRFMMNGVLLDQGLLAINVPAVRKQEFNQKMLRFYESNDTGEMEDFLFSVPSQDEIRLLV